MLTRSDKVAEAEHEYKEVNQPKTLQFMYCMVWDITKNWLHDAVEGCK